MKMRLGLCAGMLVILTDKVAHFRLGAFWRFSQNRRHRLVVSWFSLNRKAGRELLEDITFENNDGEIVTLPVGTRVNAVFDLDFYRDLHIRSMSAAVPLKSSDEMKD